MALLDRTDGEYAAAENPLMLWSAPLSPFLHSSVKNVIITFLSFALFGRS